MVKPRKCSSKIHNSTLRKRIVIIEKQISKSSGSVEATILQHAELLRRNIEERKDIMDQLDTQVVVSAEDGVAMKADMNMEWYKMKLWSK